MNMKRTVLSMVVVLMMVSCATNRLSYHDLPVSGVVEDVVLYKNKYRLDVWDYNHMRRFRMTTDKMPQPGDTIEVNRRLEVVIK